ncbi:uncharacterized protein LOC108603474 [Drosophila busckii]|uniref:uncharacterized protein LOC108603474 n=1 Tax=Drosophila busckii TaxID=30019 RepID=UPI00083F3EB9|nr:uncharacterized protein LOC108603474 [Drosophila busckii]
MFHRNLNWNAWPLELPLLHFPGQPGQQEQQPPERRYQRLPPPYIARVAPQAEPPDYVDFGERKFEKRCYLITGCFILATVAQWLLLACCLPDYDKYPLIGMVLLMMGIVVLLIFSIFVRFQCKYWLSISLACFFVEIICVSTALLLPERLWSTVGYAALATLGMMLLCHLLGACLPLAILPGEITVLIFLCIFMLGSTLFLVLYFVTSDIVYNIVYFACMGFVLIPVAVYNAEVLHGRRYPVATKEDFYLAITVLVVFDMFYMCFYYYITIAKIM